MELFRSATGFECEFNPENLDNIELLEAIAESDENPKASVRMVELMFLGTNGKKALYDFLRDEDGRVSTKAVAEVIAEIFEQFGTSPNGTELKKK